VACGPEATASAPGAVDRARRRGGRGHRDPHVLDLVPQTPRTDSGPGGVHGGARRRVPVRARHRVQRERIRRPGPLAHGGVNGSAARQRAMDERDRRVAVRRHREAEVALAGSVPARDRARLEVLGRAPGPGRRTPRDESDGVEGPRRPVHAERHGRGPIGGETDGGGHAAARGLIRTGHEGEGASRLPDGQLEALPTVVPRNGSVSEVVDRAREPGDRSHHPAHRECLLRPRRPAGRSDRHRDGIVPRGRQPDDVRLDDGPVRRHRHVDKAALRVRGSGQRPVRADPG
jgi:hypothetical protein